MSEQRLGKMDLKEKHCSNVWGKPSSSSNNLVIKGPPDKQPFSDSSSHQHQQRWEDPSLLNYGMRIEKKFTELNQTSETPASHIRNPNKQTKNLSQLDSQMKDFRDTTEIQGWDPRMMLSNMSFMEEKIHQLQDLVHSVIGQRSSTNELVAQQQQLITADLTSIIVQLISTAGSLLPSVKHIHSSVNTSVGLLGELSVPLVGASSSRTFMKMVEEDQFKEAEGGLSTSGMEQTIVVEEHEPKDEDDVDEGENLMPGTYEILQLEKEEILAPHTHFCMICGKGFKRDANLRMHMRGHGDEYKTAAALAKPHIESLEPMLIKRYSCPYSGCKRNKDHKKFQPLKNILCVKNHYKRTHCDKSYTCSRCSTKKFSVIADLKTHEKHCGKDKWLCSCGTTFSRKDKLFGHISLFQGHTPAIPFDETRGSVGLSDSGDDEEAPNKIPRLDFTMNISNASMDGKGGVGADHGGYFSPINFDTCNLGNSFPDFRRPPFEDPQSPFSLLFPGGCNYPQSNGEE